MITGIALRCNLLAGSSDPDDEVSKAPQIFEPYFYSEFSPK